jgi:uncharacterized protein YndB with AHSA1/START domain
MPTATISFDLDETPERVFDSIADVRNEAEWSTDLKRADLVTEGPLGDGSVFETEYRGFGRMRIELQEYRRPEHLVFVGDGPRMHMRFVMDVAPRDGGARVAFFIEMQPKGALKLLTPVLALGMPRELAKRPGQLRDALGAGKPA